MNFFDHQERARKNTARMVLLFLLGVLGIIVAIYGLFVVGLRGAAGDAADLASAADHMALFLQVAAGTLAVIGIGAWLKFSALSAGGSAVAESLGGRLIQSSTRDADERRFVNVVEEMAIASGVPVPAMYVLDQEEGINAFAAGRRPEDAAVAVTRGCLRTLSRDELQGVIAHEFSHIFNGDMRLNIRLLGMLGGIMALAVVGRILLHAGSRGRKKDGTALALIGLAVMVLGYVGVLVGRILQAAISRQREFLADASAVQYTRNPSGIGGALRRIRESVEGSAVKAPQAAEVGHMFFGAASLSSLFATHPPLEERIRRVEEGRYDVSDDSAGKVGGAGLPTSRMAVGGGAAGAVSGLAEVALGVAGGGRVAGTTGMRGGTAAGEAVVSAVGSMSNAALDSGSRLLSQVPVSVRSALGSPLGAQAVIFGLLLDADDGVRGEQLALLESVAGSPVARETQLLAQSLLNVNRRLRLPMIDLALPALRQMSAGQHQRFVEAVDGLVQADTQVTLFEFCTQRVISRRMGRTHNSETVKQRGLSLQEFRTHAARLLSDLARAGSGGEGDGSGAFRAGAGMLGEALSSVEMPGPLDDSHRGLGAALDAFAGASAKTRRAVFGACTRCVLFDEQVTEDEAELLRAVAYSLDLPLPPFVEM